LDLSAAPDSPARSERSDWRRILIFTWDLLHDTGVAIEEPARLLIEVMRELDRGDVTQTELRRLITGIDPSRSPAVAELAKLWQDALRNSIPEQDVQPIRAGLRHGTSMGQRWRRLIRSDQQSYPDEDQMLRELITLTGAAYSPQRPSHEQLETMRRLVAMLDPRPRTWPELLKGIRALGGPAQPQPGVTINGVEEDVAVVRSLLEAVAEAKTAAGHRPVRPDDLRHWTPPQPEPSPVTLRGGGGSDAEDSESEPQAPRTGRESKVVQGSGAVGTRRTRAASEGADAFSEVEVLRGGARLFRRDDVWHLWVGLEPDQTLIRRLAVPATTLVVHGHGDGGRLVLGETAEYGLRLAQAGGATQALLLACEQAEAQAFADRHGMRVWATDQMMFVSPHDGSVFIGRADVDQFGRLVPVGAGEPVALDQFEPDGSGPVRGGSPPLVGLVPQAATVHPGPWQHRWGVRPRFRARAAAAAHTPEGSRPDGRALRSAGLPHVPGQAPGNEQPRRTTQHEVQWTPTPGTAGQSIVSARRPRSPYLSARTTEQRRRVLLDALLVDSPSTWASLVQAAQGRAGNDEERADTAIMDAVVSVLRHDSPSVEQIASAAQQIGDAHRSLPPSAVDAWRRQLTSLASRHPVIGDLQASIASRQLPSPSDAQATTPPAAATDDQHVVDPAIERAYLAATDNAGRRSVLIDALPGLTHAAMHALAGFAADNARTVEDRADAEALRLLAFALSPSYVAGGEPDWIAGLDKVGRYEWSSAVSALHRKLPQSRSALKPLMQTLVRCAPGSS
ncbi:hypothetical protein, partial [Micromonospora sp. NPDC023814]|uniref:hypothetical protein n=1 Tax=Micromonospora sp. NPDC023814 TaxID=3154596 RepID=UPI0033DAA7B3